MKRSEMVKLLSDEKTLMLFQSEAEQILNFIEGFGMRPPPIRVESVQNALGVDEYFYVYAWEPEDEHT